MNLQIGDVLEDWSGKIRVHVLDLTEGGRVVIQRTTLSGEECSGEDVNPIIFEWGYFKVGSTAS